MLRATGTEATSVCQDDQLWVGLKSGIEGTVHRVKNIWETKSTTEDWGFLLVDTRNDFNYINHIGMLWTVFHLWPSRARFLIIIVTGHCLFFGMGMGWPVSAQ